MKIKHLMLVIVTLFWAQTAIAGSTPFDIDASNVDVFLPAPAISDDCYQLQRSYQPFGESSSLNFETAVLRAGEGSVRLTQLRIGDEEYWVDFLVRISGDDVILDISNVGLDSPPEAFPYEGSYSDSGINFTLASADIFGPPARIRIYDVAIDYVLYDFDFTSIDGVFVLTGAFEKGFMNIMTTPDDDIIVFAGKTNDDLHDGSTNYSLSLPRTPFQNPIAMFWSGEDGEHSIRMEYENGSRIQTMVATDGILLGQYLPPYAPSEEMIFFSTAAQKSQTSWWPSWWASDVSIEEKLDQCIKKKTALFVELKADPQLSAQLVDTVFSVAGSLSLSSATLDKLRDTIADSKDLVLEMMANGEVDSTTLAVFVSTTIMKNATPEEHQHIIERIWGNNVPGDVTAMAQSAGAAETNSKIALQALAEGIASHAFPAFTAAAKLVKKTADYAKDTLGNEAFRELYDIYKDSGGNWDDVNLMSVLATNKFADSTIREILKSKGEDYSNAAVESYLKNKMDTLYAHEGELLEEREKLNGYKEDYLNLSTSLKIDLRNKNYSAENPTTCDMFHMYVNIRSRIELDLKNSSRNCDNGLTITDIQSKAEFLARYWIRESSPANTASYQAAKLSWLKDNNCLNFEDDGGTPTPTEHGVWVLKETLVWLDPSINSHQCYQTSLTLSSGSFSYSDGVTEDICNWDESQSITYTGSWTVPPSTLVPGESYPMSTSVSRSNLVDQWSSSNGASVYMDYATTACGFTRSKTHLTESVQVFGGSGPASASSSDTYQSPGYGYDGAMQIKASTNSGCVRYIYEWQE